MAVPDGPVTDGWLTAVVRPAGPLGREAIGRLHEALGPLTASCDMVVVDLTAADVRNPRKLARNLLDPARFATRAGRCLLLVGAPPDLTAELDRAAVPVATLAADTLPRVTA